MTLDGKSRPDETTTCPACGSEMIPGEWCDDCGHWDDPECECKFCLEKKGEAE